MLFITLASNTDFFVNICTAGEYLPSTKVCITLSQNILILSLVVYFDCAKEKEQIKQREMVMRNFVMYNV